MPAPKGNKNHFKHGMRNSRIYNIWRSMRQRCNNPKCINYHNYGGRNIKVCDEWENSFEEFYDWSIKSGYKEGLTIDRKDVNGNYEPLNCKWATYSEQANNKRTNKFIEIDGIKHTLSEWSTITGIRIATIWARLNSGWTEKEAIMIPVGEKRTVIQK